MPRQRWIRVRGARENNLKNLDVDIPKDKLVVVTGVSGSGKTSLVFDTIYAEAQRRFLESLSAYARQFLGMLKRPDVDAVYGISPAISIEQHSTSGFTPRSTVGTMSEIYDYIRLLFAHLGTPICPEHGIPMRATSIDELVERILGEYSGMRVEVLAPMAVHKKGDFKNLFQTLLKAGFLRVYVDGELFYLDGDIQVDPKKHHDVFLVIDRIRVSPDRRERIVEDIQVAWEYANGKVAIKVGEEVQFFTRDHACPICGRSVPEMSPRLFSFNSPVGACPVCGGIGVHPQVDPELIVLHPEKPVGYGALLTMMPQDVWLSVLKACGVKPEVTWAGLPEKLKKRLLFEGCSGPMKISFGDDSWWWDFKGLVKYLEERYHNTESENVREKISQVMVQVECEHCHGTGLRPEALWVYVGDKNIEDVVKMPVEELDKWIDSLQFSRASEEIWRPIRVELKKRLKFMKDVGLGYLNLIRKTNTLSGGEAQRLRLASQLGNVLTDVLYVLDEPTIGLHPRDTDRLIEVLKTLRDKGNTVIVVEHDERVIRNADYIIDMGPGAGVNGGHVVATGSPAELVEKAIDTSITARYLAGVESIDIPEKRRRPVGWLRIINAYKFNLKHIDVSLPLGVLIAITGVSGSGKSTLAVEVLYKYLARHLNGQRISVSGVDRIEGYDSLRFVDLIDQSPIGRTPRSVPATYIGVFDKIRKLFASLPEAMARGYTPAKFSFNVPPPRGGRCEACKGMGIVKVEMQFLPDVYVECEVCGGRRFSKDVLEVRYKGYSIADVLDMSVSEALSLFRDIPSIRRDLRLLEEVGLGYIKLGQQSPTLSGGEAQRVKLASYLKGNKRGFLFVLDEPTTGLHSDDVKKLLNVLHKLVDAGNTVVVIEHNLDVVANADYVIDLGPEGGDMGGRVVATGTPENVARRDSWTALYLRKYFESRGIKI